LAVLPSVAAAGPPPVDVVKGAVELAQDLSFAADLLDRLTEVKGRPSVRADQARVLEALELSARVRVRGVEVRDFLSNEVFGQEVPGRRVDVLVKVDCIVRCNIDLREIQVALDPDYPDTVMITLPSMRVSVDYAEDTLAEYEVEYGVLRSPLLDHGKAAALRREMYAAARQKAADIFESKFMPVFREELAHELEKLLRMTFPKKRIYVRGGR